MKTRSQLKSEMKQLDFIFDFDDASREWRKNKKVLKNGQFKYKCMQLKENNGELCGKLCYKTLNFCYMHRQSKTQDPLSYFT
jgi:hypothetical protein